MPQALALARLYRNSGLGHSVFLIEPRTAAEIADAKDTVEINQDQFSKAMRQHFPIINLDQALELLDVVFCVCDVWNVPLIKKFQSIRPTNRVIYYGCGSDYTAQAEAIIFKPTKDEEIAAGPISEINNHAACDARWLIPQNAHIMYNYMKVTTGKDVKIVPFVWDSTALDLLVRMEREAAPSVNCVWGNKKDPQYIAHERRGEMVHSRIGIVEPNLSPIKFCWPSLAIAELVERRFPRSVQRAYVMNSREIVKSSHFKRMIRTFDLVYKRKRGVSMEKRYTLPFLFANYIDLVIHHQYGNGLNNLPLEVLHLGHPLVHNSPWLSDAGYFYPDFELEVGSDGLSRALAHHSRIALAYKERARSAVHRFSAENARLVQTYDLLLHEVLTGIKDDPKLNHYQPLSNTMDISFPGYYNPPVPQKLWWHALPVPKELPTIPPDATAATAAAAAEPENATRPAGDSSAEPGVGAGVM